MAVDPNLERARRVDLRPRGGLASSLRDGIYRLRKKLKRAARSDGVTEADRVSTLEELIEREDWDSARQVALELGAVAEERGNAGLMKKAGRMLRRLGVGTRAWELLSLSKGSDLPEWDGSALTDRIILVERREGDLAIFLQFASALAAASTIAKRCIVLVENRIGPLYRRSFPALDVREEGVDDASARGEADVFASFETLAQHLWPSEEERLQRFAPLRADRGLVDTFTTNYRAPGKKLVGLSWGSLSKGKDPPALADWDEVLGKVPATFVSLQYGDVRPAIDEFARRGADQILVDPSVDQLADMDRFAAQVSAMDGIVTISNTLAHLAGALAIPTIVILDDKFHLSWPIDVDGPRPYPRCQLVRRRGRSWPVVMSEARDRLERLLRAEQ